MNVICHCGEVHALCMNTFSKVTPRSREDEPGRNENPRSKGLTGDFVAVLIYGMCYSFSMYQRSAAAITSGSVS